MRLDRLHVLEKGLELWYWQTRSTKARLPFYFQTFHIRHKTNLKHLLSDADHAVRNSSS